MHHDFYSQEIFATVRRKHCLFIIITAAGTTSANWGQCQKPIPFKILKSSSDAVPFRSVPRNSLERQNSLFILFRILNVYKYINYWHNLLFPLELLPNKFNAALTHSQCH